MILTLFPDQEEIVDLTLLAMKRKRRILLQSATGSGKTAIGTHLIQRARRKEKRVVFTVPRKDLLEQTSDTFREYGIDHSFIAAGKTFNPYASVWIGMVDTMAQRLKKDLLPKEIDLLEVDECHFGDQALDSVMQHYSAPSKKRNGLDHFCWTLGLSATPWKLSGKGFRHQYDEIIIGKSVQWLIDNKRLSEYDYYHGKTKPDFSDITIVNNDYAKGEIAEFMEQQGVIIGDCVRDYRQRCMGRLHIVRCTSVKHSQIVAQAFRDAGIPAVHVDGETEMDERRRIFKAYARREILVLTFCDLLNFGFDLSQASGIKNVTIESGSDMKPSKSLAGQMQFWGRMLRYKPYPAIINDHVNNYIEHGLPCFDRNWSLDPRAKKKGGEKVPPSRQCPKCYYVHPPAPVCPNKNPPCGHVYEVQSRQIEEAEGDLHKIDKDALKGSVKKIASKISFESMLPAIDSQDALEYLINYAQQQGKPNPTQWAANEMARRINKASVKQNV